ncbi:MAG: alpha-E domain-containing protein [Leeuwenhoekiella sp.]
MLARVANNLFWMGRYIERAEHIARFVNVNYFSSLDAPDNVSQSRQIVLRSLMGMADNTNMPDDELEEQEVLFNIGLNPEKIYSIYNCVKFARENANSARDLISTEIYETINKFFHFVNGYSADVLVKKGLYEFSTTVTESAAVIRGKIRGTILHDDVYAIIMTGVHIERAMQVTRIIRSKSIDAKAADERSVNGYSNSYEWTTLLKCVESYDMMRRFYKKTPNSEKTIDFLILQEKCPRSFMNCLNQLYKHIQELSGVTSPKRGSSAFLIGKIRAEYKYKAINEIHNDIPGLIKRILSQLIDIAECVEKEFFDVSAINEILAVQYQEFQ